jgi:uncharacterized membrane protein
MSSQSHLLQRATLLAQKNQLCDAKIILNSLITSDPQNLEAWKIYFNISAAPKDLEWLKERVILTRGMRAVDKVALLALHDERLRQLSETKKPHKRMAINGKRSKGPQEPYIIFELLEEFNYSDTLTRPTFKFQMPAVLKKVFNYPFPKFGLGLVAVFFIAVRFMVLGYFSGLPLMILFSLGVANWLDESSKGRR